MWPLMMNTVVKLSADRNLRPGLSLKVYREAPVSSLVRCASPEKALLVVVLVLVPGATGQKMVASTIIGCNVGKEAKIRLAARSRKPPVSMRLPCRHK